MKRRQKVDVEHLCENIRLDREHRDKKGESNSSQPAVHEESHQVAEANQHHDRDAAHRFVITDNSMPLRGTGDDNAGPLQFEGVNILPRVRGVGSLIAASAPLMTKDISPGSLLFLGRGAHPR